MRDYNYNINSILKSAFKMESSASVGTTIKRSADYPKFAASVMRLAADERQDRCDNIRLDYRSNESPRGGSDAEKQPGQNK